MLHSGLEFPRIRTQEAFIRIVIVSIVVDSRQIKAISTVSSCGNQWVHVFTVSEGAAGLRWALNRRTKPSYYPAHESWRKQSNLSKVDTQGDESVTDKQRD